jgi:hypothetical protein
MRPILTVSCAIALIAAITTGIAATNLHNIDRFSQVQRSYTTTIGCHSALRGQLTDYAR